MNDQIKVQGWVARDEDGALRLCVGGAPTKAAADIVRLWNPKSKGCWITYDVETRELDSALFPSVKWEDAEPTEVEITIKIKQK